MERKIQTKREKKAEKGAREVDIIHALVDIQIELGSFFSEDGLFSEKNINSIFGFAKANAIRVQRETLEVERRPVYSNEGLVRHTLRLLYRVLLLCRYVNRYRAACGQSAVFWTREVEKLDEQKEKRQTKKDI